MFSAAFRLKRVSRKEKEERVVSLIYELGLKHVADSFVGDEENRGISGGERKRVSIGVDLIHNPSILLLDEPTSGLDSSSALQVIELLASMAQTKQRTVVISIHQPSYRILQYISNFLILTHGTVVHNGSLELLEETIDKLGFQIPIQLNALEFAMEIIHTLEDYNETAVVGKNNAGSSGWIRISKCVYKSEERRGRNRGKIGSVCIQSQLSAFLHGGSTSNISTRAARSDERSFETSLQDIIIHDRKHSCLLALFIRCSCSFRVPVYWIVGLNPSMAAFAFFTFVVWLILLMASSLVLFLSAVSPDFISGNSLICTVLGAFFLFSGYFIPKENIPKYWMFMYYVSLYRYPLDSLLTNEYWSMRGECFSWNADHDHQQHQYKCLMTGNEVLIGRGLEKDTRWMNVGIMFGFFVISCSLLVHSFSEGFKNHYIMLNVVHRNHVHNNNQVIIDILFINYW
ncbi:hypothetical protein LWI28_026643 [Acer negundo]|uniref:ABC transporter G family member 23 n=1 Tax=Acer negundo TaxID=4023 RepID=A0AAD5JER7_ACENE|nr:hypothetical protein LWI28_026643 [Acer negundo]